MEKRDAADKLGWSVLHDKHPGYVDALDRFKEVWTAYENRDEDKQGMKALNIMIDALCHARLVRKVEVTTDEYQELFESIQAWLLNPSGARGIAEGMREGVDCMLFAVGLKPPKGDNHVR